MNTRARRRGVGQTLASQCATRSRLASRLQRSRAAFKTEAEAEGAGAASAAPSGLPDGEGGARDTKRSDRRRSARSVRTCRLICASLAAYMK